MFRIAKNLVKTFEQSVQGLSQDGSQLDAFFQSIPPNLLATQLQQHEQDTLGDTSAFNGTVSGLRVVWVHELQLQLQSYFDFIVGINDDPLPLINNQHGYMYPDYNAIIQYINQYSNNTLKLNVWSAKGGIFKDIYIQIRSKDETHMDEISLSNGSNNTTDTNKLFEPLGFKVQWSPLIAATFTYHILQLNIQNGPAHLAGLIPDEDYIIGCQDGLLATGGETLLQDIVRSRANQELILYVYNKISDSVRPITVNIGPDGRLGCGIGSGFLHRIPTVKVQDQIGDNIQLETQPLPPINSETAFIPSVMAPPPKSAQKKKKTTKDTALMTDYFTEGKDQSSRQQGTPSDDVPPPVSHK